MVESLEIGCADLTSPKMANINAVLLRGGDSSRVRWVADVPISRAGGIRLDLQLHPFSLAPKGSFGKG